MRRENAEPRRSPHRLRALIPGLGHLALGHTGRGVRLMLFSVATIFLVVWRWDRFIGAFSTPFLDRWPG